MFEVIGLWQEEVQTVRRYSLPCGHLLPEEDPEGVVAAMRDFFAV